MSVLATMNSTPLRPTSTIRLTALLPPPPTPITLILAPRLVSGSSVSLSLSSIIFATVQRPSEEFFEDAAEPQGCPAECAGAVARIRGAIAMRVEHDADRRREYGTVHVIGQTANADGASAPNRQ